MRDDLERPEKLRPQRFVRLQRSTHWLGGNLARRMAVSEHALETFRTINGLSPGEALAPGRKVKLIVE